jgi:hypothetical protein
LISRFITRIGGWRPYLPALAVIAVSVVLIYVPGKFASDDPVHLFVVSGSSALVLAIGWIFLQVDRRVSNNPRYQRPAYREDQDSDDET